MSIIRDGLLSADLDVPVVLPTLNLDFANSQELDPRITFSRGSIGTFVNRNGLIETVAANTPRFDYDPISGECKGLLIEEQRTNLVLNSTTFNFWDTNNLTDGTLNPDGSAAIVRIPNSNGTFHGTTVVWGTTNLDSIGIATGATYDVTLSMWVKNYNSSDMGILFVKAAFLSGIPNTNASYHTKIAKPKTPTWGSGGAGSGWSKTYENIIPYPNGWYRFILSSRYTRQSNQNTLEYGIQIFNNRDAQFYRGDNSSGIYIWGPQVEQGAFPTSYIPTGASTVTRSADRASIEGTNFSSWYNQNEGSVFTSYQQNTNVVGYNFGVFSLTSSTSNNNNLIDYFVGNGLSAVFRLAYNGNSQQVYEYGGTSSANIKNKGAFSFTTNKFFKCINGTFYSTSLVSPITSGIKIPTVNTLVLGTYWAGLQPLNGTISRLTYYPKALSPSQLQYLTQ